MLNLIGDTKPDDEKYRKNISSDGACIYVNLEKYLFAGKEIAGRMISAQNILRDTVCTVSMGDTDDISKDTILRLLTDVCGLSEKYFKARASKRLSMDKTKVIYPLMETLRNMEPMSYRVSEAYILLSAYLEYSNLASVANIIASKITKHILQPCDLKSASGGALCKINFSYTQRATGRYYTSNDSLQNYPLAVVKSFEALKDHFFIWCDFKNIDLRVAANLILFKDNPEQLKEFSAYPDRYEGFVRTMSKALDIPFNLEDFKKNRDGFKKGILAKMYGTSNASLGLYFPNKEMISSLSTFYEKNTPYQEYRTQLLDTIAQGDDLELVDYFGVSMILPRLQKGSVKANIYHLLNQALNRPMQCTSNSIIEHWTNSAIDMYRKLGYTEDDFSVALNRHDETVFMASIKMLPDLWRLADLQTVAIDDWEPLEVKINLGINYKQEDTELEDFFKKTVDAHQNSMTPRTVFTKANPNKKLLMPVLNGWCFSVLEPLAFVKKHFAPLMNSLQITRTWERIRANKDPTELQAVLKAYIQELKVQMQFVNELTTELPEKFNKKEITSEEYVQQVTALQYKLVEQPVLKELLGIREKLQESNLEFTYDMLSALVTIGALKVDELADVTTSEEAMSLLKEYATKYPDTGCGIVAKQYLDFGDKCIVKSLTENKFINCDSLQEYTKLAKKLGTNLCKLHNGFSDMYFTVDEIILRVVSTEKYALLETLRKGFQHESGIWYSEGTVKG